MDSRALGTRTWAYVAASVAVGTVFGSCSLAGLDDYLGRGGSASTGTGGGGGGAVGTGGSACGGADFDNDPDNCGACGVRCAAGYGCLDAVCGNAPVDVGSAGMHMCVVLRGGEVWCWGRNGWGEAGVDPADPQEITIPSASGVRCVPGPVKIAGITDAVEVAIASESTCVRMNNGKVFCWGSNEDGTLGHAPGAGDSMCVKAISTGDAGSGTVGPCSFTPVEVVLPAGAAELKAGSHVVCARTIAGDVYCWGKNNVGQLQAPPNDAPTAGPVKNANVHANAIGLAISSSEGWSTLCVRRMGAGRVDCWGESLADVASGPTLSGPTLFPTAGADGCDFSQYKCDPIAHTVPMNFSTSSGQLEADDVAVGYMAGCALRKHVVTCWGGAEFGQIGGLSAGEHVDPTAIMVMPAIAAVTAPYATTMMLDVEGSVWALGWTSTGQSGGTTGVLCRGDQSCVTAPTKVLGASEIVKIGGAGSAMAAITNDWKVLTWGSNHACELGHEPGTAGDFPQPGLPEYYVNPTPVPVAGLPK